MPSLDGRSPASSYKDLLQVSNANSGVDTTLRSVEDGEGTSSALQLSTTAVKATGTLEVAGNLGVGTSSPSDCIHILTKFNNNLAGLTIRAVAASNDSPSLILHNNAGSIGACVALNGAGGGFGTGANPGDLILRAVTKNIHLSSDASTNNNFTVNSTGLVGVNKPSSIGSQLHVVSSTQWLKTNEQDRRLDVRDLVAEIVALNDPEALATLQAVTTGLLSLCEKIALHKNLIS